MSQPDAPRRTTTQPRELVAAHRRGDPRETGRDRFDPVSVALAAWTGQDAVAPTPPRPARSGHPAPQQRQPWLPAGAGGRVDPRDVARAAMAAQAAAAATGTEEHPISDQDARPGLISRLTGRVRDARSADDTPPVADPPAASTATDGHSPAGSESPVATAETTDGADATDPADEVDQEGSWIHHDGSDGPEGWRYHYADGTVVDADGNVVEPSDHGTEDTAPAPDASGASHEGQDEVSPEGTDEQDHEDRDQDPATSPRDHADHEDDSHHDSSATAGTVGTALAAGVATAHQSSSDGEGVSARDEGVDHGDHGDHADDGDDGDQGDDTDHDGVAEHEGHRAHDAHDAHDDAARTDERDRASESERPDEDDATTGSAVETDEATDEQPDHADADAAATGPQDDVTTDGAGTGGKKHGKHARSSSEPAETTSVPAFVEYSPSEAPRYALGAVAALAAVGAVLIGFSAVADSSGSDLVLVLVLALVAAAALWALERWSPTVVTVDDGTLEVTRGSTVDRIDLRDPALDVDLGTDTRSPSWSATFAEPEGSHVTLRRTQVRAGQFAEIVRHHRANLRTPETEPEPDED